jgi:hypothetical protein
LLCVKHWFKELDDPQAAAGPSQAFADTPIGQSLLKLDESQRKPIFWPGPSPGLFKLF